MKIAAPAMDKARGRVLGLGLIPLASGSPQRPI